MRHATLTLFALIAFSCVAGCQSCFRLDEFRLVPATPGVSGGGGATTGPGGGGFGGVPEACDDPPTGSVFVAAPVAAGESRALPCETMVSTNGGIDIMALDPSDGTCNAHARIEAQTGAIIDAAPRLLHTANDRFHVAARYRDGDVTLPDDCTGAAVVVAAEPSASDGLFIASLQRSGTSLCTEWVRRGWTTDVATFAVHDLDGDAERVAVGGSFGGANVQLEDGTGTIQAQGAAFMAAYDSDGTLISIDTFGSTSEDAVHGVRLIAEATLVTGTLRDEDPGCHGCSGTSHVVDAADNCSGTGGAGGAGGSGGAGGAGGAGGLADSQNAWLWSRLDDDTSCARLASHGADTDGSSDAQAGYHVGIRQGADCTTYWTGLAGSNAWRWDIDAAETELFDAASTTADGFLITAQGSSCGVDASYRSSVRMIPGPGGTAAWGSRVEALVCTPGALSAMVVMGNSTSLELARCDAAGTCNQDVELALPGAARQLVVASLDDQGSPRWHGALGPVDISTMVTDDADRAHIIFTTTQTMQLQNMDVSACSDIAQGAAAGTYVMTLAAGGDGDRAACTWAARLGP